MRWPVVRFFCLFVNHVVVVIFRRNHCQRKGICSSVFTFFFVLFVETDEIVHGRGLLVDVILELVFEGRLGFLTFDLDVLHIALHVI